MRTFKIISFYILIAIPQFFFFIPYIVFADGWGLDNQPFKYEWGLDEQTVKYEWGLEEQNYNGTKWTKQKSGTNYLLLGIWGNKKDNVYVIGTNQTGRYEHIL